MKWTTRLEKKKDFYMCLIKEKSEMTNKHMKKVFNLINNEDMQLKLTV